MEEYKAGRAFLGNVKGLFRNIHESVFRHGRPTSDRARTQTVVQNFFLHIHPARINRHSLKVTTTLGLGIMTLALFIILTITGILLMLYYKPSVDGAYDSIKDIHNVVPTGRMMRNVHRWAAEGMVVMVLLHMGRVFYTSAYKGPRAFNWVLGMTLFVLTLALSFTGYLLPWDQLAFWAVTIGSGIAGSTTELTDALGVTQHFDPGTIIREGLLGAHYIGEEALIRFYTLHIMILPIVLVIIAAVHFWRIRKDGGLVRPEAANQRVPAEGTTPEQAPTKTFGLMAVMRQRTPATNLGIDNTIPSWPRVFIVEATLTMLVLLATLILSLCFDAPLREIANPDVPENPAKAPWYFLGLQELVSYSAFMGGMVIPAIVVVGLSLVPYLDREPEDVGIWFSGPRGRRVTAASVLFGVVLCVGMLVFTVKYGWLRNWEWSKDVPQLVIVAINPGTVFVLACAAWSLGVMRFTNSTRMAAIGLFTAFFVCFLILTYFATVHRGPNWDFYWSESDWPVMEHK
jgi:quinol-cytochrome oxidoreductase complex cytochrome b subunit